VCPVGIRRNQRSRGSIGIRQALDALSERSDDRSPETLAENCRDSPLEPRPRLDHACEGFVLALDGGAGQFRLDRCELAGECGATLRCLPRLRSGPLLMLGGVPEGVPRLLRRLLQWRDGRERLTSAVLGLLGLFAEGARLRTRRLVQLGQLGLQLLDPGGEDSLLGSGIEFVEPKLPLAEAAPELSLGMLH
jgi:hypothetical protein